MFIFQNFGGLPGWAWILAALAALSLFAIIARPLYLLISRLSIKNLTHMAGFAYDPAQDIFYSEMNAWQRRFGYCRLYDEAAPLFNMIIDSEPIRFRYGGKNWLIELWKGQYGMTTGAEIGVYYTRARVDKDFNRTLYHSVKDKDMLPMSLKLLKDGRALFNRRQRHWWLTGFALGEFSDPSDLLACCDITFPAEQMRDAFINALVDLGYGGSAAVGGLTVRVIFTTPLSAQPSTRTPESERRAQTTNKALCGLWHEITDGIEGAPNKLEAVRAADPGLYKTAAAFGKTPVQYLTVKRGRQ